VLVISRKPGEQSRLANAYRGTAVEKNTNKNQFCLLFASFVSFVVNVFSEKRGKRISRTTLCAVTAAVLALISVAIMVIRYQVMGIELWSPPLDANAAGISPLKRMFLKLSLFSLPPDERRFVEILLLLPIGALIICIFRNVIGLSSFGTFAPALLGLAFHDLHSLPGIFVFVSIVLIGWLMRRVLDSYHLLHVPRVATMLTLIMMVLIAAVLAAHVYGAATTRYVSLFPMIILCGMVERFWTLESEDSTSASFRTLFQTMLISTVIALLLSSTSLGQHVLRFPETLGLIMAAQMLIGRYTGYRFMELLRFRDFLKRPALEDHP
jgi:hypothetical protein